MNFLNPILLFGIAGVSVPIIIHMLNRTKVQRVPWAAMRFLQAAVETNQRRLQIEDLLLLLLRILLIALIAFALARPAIKAAAGLLGQPASATLILIDDSYSMSQTTGVSSRFDVAKRAARQVIDSLASGSSVAVWTAGDTATPIIAEPTRDMALARRVIDDLKPGDRATEFLPAVQQGISKLKAIQSSAKDLFLITDGQRSGFRQMSAIRQLLDADKETIKTTVLMIDQPETANLALTSLTQASGVAAIDRPLRFSAVVTNFGEETARDVRVSLKLESTDATDRATSGQAPVDESTIDQIEPGQSKSVSLFGSLRSDGYHAVTAQITPDRLPADDTRTIVVRGTKRVRVLLVDGDVGSEPRDSETFFLRAVFAASGTEQQPALIESTVTDPGAMGSETLEGYDAVVMANVSEVTESVADLLNKYVRQGGGLLIFPGGRVSRPFYNEVLAGRFNLLPATLGEAKGDEKSQAKVTTFSDTALDHPIATLWKDPASGQLSNVNIYRYMPLLPAVSRDKNDQPSRVVLKLIDGNPAVMEKSVGDGRVIMFDTTADSAWSDLPAKPGIYVPLLYRMIGSIVEKRDEALNISVGQKFSIRTALEQVGKDAEIRYLPPADEGDQTPVALPQVHRIELVDNKATILSDPAERAGAYEVKVPTSAPLLFAAQTDPGESDVQPLTGDELTQLKSSATVLETRIDSDVAGNLKRERTGTELIFPLAILLLLLGVTEAVAAMWFSRTR